MSQVRWIVGPGQTKDYVSSEVDCGSGQTKDYVSSEVDCGSGQTKDYKIVICCFSA